MRRRQAYCTLIGVLAGPGALADSLTLMHVTDSANNLVTVDMTTGHTERIGGTAGQFTDVAFDAQGRLLGITSAYLYEIDPQTGWSTLIGAHGFGAPGNFHGIDALTFGSDGGLYAAGDDTLITIDPTTGAGTWLGHLSGYRSAGDLAEDAQGRLVLTTDAGVLVQVFRDGSGASPIGDIPFDDVFALGATADGQLYGLRAGGAILRFDTATGQGNVIGTIDADFLIGYPYGGTFANQFLPEPSTLALILIGAARCLQPRRRRGRVAST